MNNEKFLKTACLLFAFVLQSAMAFSQNLTISGTVTDERGVSLPGVTVAPVGGTGGVATKPDGKYTITVAASVKALRFSFLGFAPKEVPLTGGKTLNVTLISSSTTLNDVVVVGYGSVRKKDLTGAVANVTAKDFNPGVISNPLQQIQGKVPGLSITQPGGDPNANLIVRLRGQTSLSGGQTPLIVVDGIPLDNPNQISNIPASDIESYDVLKDVSATAIYGSRGANGVIIINTKKGAAGRTRVEYNGYAAIDKLRGDYNLLSADEWRSAVQQIPNIDQQTISALDKGANTDWLKAITRTAFTNSNNLGVSGGTETFNYRASLNYMNQQGIVINTNKEQLGLRFSAEQKALNNKLNIQTTLSYSQNKRKLADYNIFEYVNTTPPTFPVTNPDGSYYGYFDYHEQNPVAQQMLQTNTSNDYLTQLYAKVDYKLLSFLTLGTTGSISHLNTQTGFFQPVLPGVGNKNNASQGNANVDSKKGDVHLNFLKDFNKHHLSGTLVYEFNDFVNSNFNASGQEYLVEDLGDNNLGAGNSAKNVISSYKEEFIIESYLARAQYNYNSTYYLTASFRRDGSNKFGANNRWGSFPSVSAAWRIKNESFLKNVTWLDDLKINAGYGVVGNQDAINPYNTLLLLGSGGRFYTPGNPTNQYPDSYTPIQNANADLQWERRIGRNIGFNFSMFNSRFTGNINAFNDKTKDLLFNYTVPVPPYVYNSILANVGDLKNKGLEIQLSGDVIKGKDFSWSPSGQITFTKTTITSLSGSYNGTDISTDMVPIGVAQGRGYQNNYLTYLKVGQSPYVFYLPKFAGVASAISPTSNSNQLYYDAAGNTTPDISKAKYDYIDPTPKFTYGISNTFNYKQLSLNFFLRGVYGQKLFNNYDNIVSNYSRLPGNNVTHNALTNGIRGSQTTSDYWLQNASYLKLDNVTLAYNFRQIKGLDNLRVYVTGSNLLTFTPYKGIDPEVVNGDSAQSYIDANMYGYGYYPKSRTFILGASVAFK
ncbi:SusC/RagA family TonB-linked outer membrane protein [Mucilaginibacter agri]|uniref:SusC/RagA family TonB-linked outer membrane protein n=1 Tax=Mucilaginibacter agri TaxID=2695265 RepID=A0A965ZKT1_9SPHI|nr:SusC/RagA family TonB-linked outer membrane protein [Mucilaginibacter agri]NCD72515.1 SusC/RagA family TonB-linked outer membrane protein [Mucilaginibacter agri]